MTTNTAASATTATTTATTTTTAATSINPSSNRYATWLEQRTIKQHQQPLQSNDDYTDQQQQQQPNHNNHSTSGGGDGGGSFYESLHPMRYTSTSTATLPYNINNDGEEMELNVWNTIEYNRRQRRIEYYYNRMERYYNNNHHDQKKYLYQKLFVICFIYWYTYIFDLLITLLLGYFTILLWYHKQFDLKDIVVHESSDNNIEPTPRLYIITISTLFVFWLIRTIAAMIGLKNNIKYQEAAYNSRMNHSSNNNRNNMYIDNSLLRFGEDYSRHYYPRHRRCFHCFPRSCCCCCCCRRWGLYVTSNIISPITILLYITIVFIISWIHYSNNESILSSKYVLSYLHHHRLYIPSFILRHVIYPLLDPYESNISPTNTSTVHHHKEYIWFIIIMIIMILLEYIRWKVIASYRIYLIYCDQYYYSCINYNNDDNDDDGIYDDENYIALDQRLLMEQPLIVQQQHSMNYDNQNIMHNTSGDNTYSSEVIRYGIPAWVIEPSGDHEDDITCLSNSMMTDHSSSIIDNRSRESNKKSNPLSLRRFSTLFSSSGGGGHRRDRFRYHNNDDNNEYDNGDDRRIIGGTTTIPSNTTTFSSIQEEWASLSEEDPHWWSRDDYEQRRRSQQQQQQQQLQQWTKKATTTSIVTPTTLSSSANSSSSSSSWWTNSLK